MPRHHSAIRNVIVTMAFLVPTIAAAADKPSVAHGRMFGIAKPVLQAVMPSLVQGAINEVHVQEGQTVKKGDLLVSLDSKLPRAALLVAKAAAERTGEVDGARAALKLAQKQYSRIEQAFKSNAGSRFEVETQRAQLEQSEAILRQAQEAVAGAQAALALRQAELDQYSIRAPFDGTIIQIHSKTGTAVDGSIPVITVADLSALEIEMFLPITMYGKIKVGSKLPVQANAPINRELTGHVASVSPVINAASSTFRALIRIENKDGKLPAGFSVTVNEPSTSPRTAAK